MPINLISTPMKGLAVFEKKIFSDERGYFSEDYKKSDMVRAGLEFEIVQENISFSKKGVLRGLHFQKKPFSQGKYVRCIHGKIFDVAVDIRRDSETFSQNYHEILTPENGKIIYMDEGFAHGFLALEDSILVYGCTREYKPEYEGGIIWNDPELKIEWPQKPSVISKKDSSFKTLKEQDDLF